MASSSAFEKLTHTAYGTTLNIWDTESSCHMMADDNGKIAPLAELPSPSCEALYSFVCFVGNIVILPISRHSIEVGAHVFLAKELCAEVFAFANSCSSGNGEESTIR